MCSSLDRFHPSLSQASFCFNETDVPSLIKTCSNMIMKEWASVHNRRGEDAYKWIIFNIFVRVILRARTHCITLGTHNLTKHTQTVTWCYQSFSIGYCFFKSHYWLKTQISCHTLSHTWNAGKDFYRSAVHKLRKEIERLPEAEAQCESPHAHERVR